MGALRPLGRPPSIQWYYKQWLGDDDVLGMEWDATGMHHHLLMISIQQEPPGSLPNDMALIRRWLRSPSEETWRRVQPQIFSAWTLRGDRWFNAGMVGTMERQAKYRERYETGTKSSAKVQKIEEEHSFLVVGLEEKPPNSDALVERIARAYPGNLRKHGQIQAIPQAQLWAIIEAIARDGADLVEQGTLAYAEKVKHWPANEKKWVMNACKFFGPEAFYLKDPEEWERRNGADTKHSKAAETVLTNREVLRADLYGATTSAIAGGGGKVLQASPDAGRAATVGGDV